MDQAYSLSEPAGSGALIAAMQWLQGTLLGSMATAIAVIAVASVGMLMLGGRIDVRRGMTVILGCFVLFGAPSIAAGLSGLGGWSGVSPPSVVVAAPVPVPAPMPAPTAAPPTQYDPYAGASVR